MWQSIFHLLPDLAPSNEGAKEKKENPQSEETYVIINKKLQNEKRDFDIYFNNQSANTYDKEFNYRKYAEAKEGEIIRIEELRELVTEELSTLKISILLPEGVTYQPAQNIVFYAENTTEDVLEALEYLKIPQNESHYVFLSEANEKNLKFKTAFPLGTEISVILKKFIDLKGSLKFFNKKIKLEKNFDIVGFGKTKTN